MALSASLIQSFEVSFKILGNIVYLFLSQKLSGVLSLSYPIKELVKTEPKITIGVCVKNGEKVLSGAVESILSQDFPHEFVEVIFVDDGSVDSTLSLMQRYVRILDMPVSVFHHEWQGLGPTRNVVCANARGKYVVWVDGDMTFPKDFVRQQFEFMEINPLVGIGKAKYGLSSQASLASELENMEFAITNIRSSKDRNSAPLGAGGCIYRATALRQVGGFNERIQGSGEDMDIERRIKAVGWVLTITPAVFFENRRKNWKSLWAEYAWHGKGGGYLFKNHNQSFSVKTLFPLLILKDEFGRVIVAYKLTRRKTALLLPVHYFFKRAAWAYGFLKSVLSTKT